ncbi:MAG: DUF2917 domain-containing protein [Burkholderiaceae bacterium]
MEPRIICRDSHGTDFELREAHPLRLRHARGCRIQALAGTIWITAYDELADIELYPGQSFTLPNDRLALVEPVGRGTVRVAPPASVRGTLARWLTALRRRPQAACAGSCVPAAR